MTHMRAGPLRIGFVIIRVCMHVCWSGLHFGFSIPQVFGDGESTMKQPQLVPPSLNPLLNCSKNKKQRKNNLWQLWLGCAGDPKSVFECVFDCIESPA